MQGKGCAEGSEGVDEKLQIWIVVAIQQMPGVAVQPVCNAQPAMPLHL